MSKEEHPKCAPHLFVPDSILVEVTRASQCVYCRISPQRHGDNYASAFCSERCRRSFKRAFEKKKRQEEIARNAYKLEDLS